MRFKNSIKTLVLAGVVLCSTPVLAVEEPFNGQVERDPEKLDRMLHPWKYRPQKEIVVVPDFSNRLNLKYVPQSIRKEAAGPDKEIWWVPIPPNRR